MSFTDTNVINFQEKKWEKEFTSDMQKAMDEVVNVLCTHLSPDIGVVVGKAIATTLKEVSEDVLSKIEEIETEDKSLPFS